MVSDYRKQEQSEARRRAAWELLKDTRNPEYVALRYDYPVETMRKALAKIPPDTPAPFRRSPGAEACHSTIRRASELIPETLRRSRVPGEDDDLGEDDGPSD